METELQGAPASPCVGVCRLDAGGRWCVGCRRTPAEIAAWPAADAPARERILAAARERRWRAP